MGIVERITYHNPENGWTVLKVSPQGGAARRRFSNEGIVPVVVHQVKIFAGATMEFRGEWIDHKEYGRQFKASEAIEHRPATVAALEKYLGSGLIYGVGPKTAKKIVKHFGNKTLEVFEDRIERLVEVSGIADCKLKKIKESWSEHREIRDIMMFLQSHGVSTLFAVKIYKTYGNRASEVVSKNPYQLAADVYGIGFFSADRIALKMGFAPESEERMSAAIRHALSSSREEGHCYLTCEQIKKAVIELLKVETIAEDLFTSLLERIAEKKEIIVRELKGNLCYYSPSLFYDEIAVANKIRKLLGNQVLLDRARVKAWLDKYTGKEGLTLSDEQRDAVERIVGNSFAILTGGPGCGKTTTTRVLVKLLQAMGKQILLAAPTGRAAQRMMEVIGLEAKTLHRLLVWNPQNGRFKKCETDPLECDFLIVDESSMLDISLAADLLAAVPVKAQLLLIGDADQLPAVGAGNVLKDLLAVRSIPCFKLTKIFRQAEASSIIRYAHEINKGVVPKIESPIHRPTVWEEKVDCLFIDSEEINQEGMQFIYKARKLFQSAKFQDEMVKRHNKKQGDYVQRVWSSNEGDINVENCYIPEEQELSNAAATATAIFTIPKKLEHIDLQKLAVASLGGQEIEEIKNVLKRVHPWSTLNFGVRAIDMIKKLYLETIPRYLGDGSSRAVEIQLLSPMLRGGLGTLNLNLELQQTLNPARAEVAQMKLGDKIFREADRVIQKRNNYDLGVFNGDIGKIVTIDPIEMMCEVEFDHKVVMYEKEHLMDLDLAYAITIHKSQGSEFDVVIIPVMTQHFKMLFRNLIYTGLTRAKRLAIFVGTRKAMCLAIKNVDARERQTTLRYLF
ncbi:MAG: AAA family ATPase [Oligoflexia bacterium]|nr:AAA family ATPase [Oligoflexia bacterium]